MERDALLLGVGQLFRPDALERDIPSYQCKNSSVWAETLVPPCRPVDLGSVRGTWQAGDDDDGGILDRCVSACHVSLGGVFCICGANGSFLHALHHAGQNQWCALQRGRKEIHLDMGLDSEGRFNRTVPRALYGLACLCRPALTSELLITYHNADMRLYYDDDKKHCYYISPKKMTPEVARIENGSEGVPGFSSAGSR